MKSFRLWVMWGAAAAVVAWYWLTDPDSGAETIMRLQWLAWLCVAAGPVAGSGALIAATSWAVVRISWAYVGPSISSAAWSAS